MALNTEQLRLSYNSSMSRCQRGGQGAEPCGRSESVVVRRRSLKSKQRTLFSRHRGGTGHTRSTTNTVPSGVHVRLVPVSQTTK